ncbi:VOC family protein [Pendulispora rubella]|uniref:VOC family protein n=1 Tax=Pendulispora rubella TaxID=2741070 RepID=A0ABZ2L3G9_9BACT
MPEIDQHQPTTFCPSQLATRDVQRAKIFYNELFGWTFDDVRLPAGDVYTRCRVRGREVAAFRQVGREAGWTLCISVHNVDTAVQRATRLGGRVRSAPNDLLNLGRMATIEDRDGATFGVWQSQALPATLRARPAGEVSTACWHELSADDPADAQQFYTELFGWRARTSHELGREYTEFRVGAQAVGGLVKKPAPRTPPSWIAYFSVRDCDWAARIAAVMGGQIVAAPRDLPTVGRFALVRDTEGSVFGILGARPS